MKKYLRILYLTGVQINFLVSASKWLAKYGPIGKFFSILLDNLMLTLYGIELTSSSLSVNRLVVGHSTGVVLGGNGIYCSGTLHLSSGVVFGRRYGDSSHSEVESFFCLEGDVTVGANSVLLGPLKVKGPVIIGALSLVTHDITEPGIYVGAPAKMVRRLPADK